jgi:protein gp37
VGKTKIEWADFTFNPWLGCDKVSAACTNCYAESWAKRTGQAGLWRGERRRTSVANWRLPLKWNRETPGARVFCASLADVFEDREELADWRLELFDLISGTPDLTWLLLTKRPENAARYFRHPDMLSNVWLGTTVENQAAAERIPHLLRVPARVRFLSCEPLLGPVDIRQWLGPQRMYPGRGIEYGVEWVIAGGESGPRARPSHPNWFRSLRDQCRAAGVAFHFKQWGEFAPSATVQWTAPEPHGPPDREDVTRVGKTRAGRVLDGRTWDEVPHV